MERKDYLVEQLSKEEKAYLKRIIMTARNKYIKKNYKYINETIALDEEILTNEEENIIDKVIENCLKEVKSAEKFEEKLSNPLLYEYVKALSLREKEVLFYLFWEKKQINEVVQIMNADRKTIRTIRNRALSKIADNMINGGKKNV